MIRTARLRAFAKLNLGLRVLYKRPDGYHELRTVFQTISLADRLSIIFTKSRKTRIEVTGAADIPDNIVVRAAALTLEAMKIQADVRFDLKKNIPSGAGLGGGSSDAAAVLLSLPALAGRVVPEPELLSLAAQLGSDVPFFLKGGTALGLGRGEELYPLPDMPRTAALLVAPAIHSSTGEAYSDLSRKLPEKLTSIGLQNKLSTFQKEVWQGAGKSFSGFSIDENDFEEVVFRRYPELGRIRERLRRLGAEPAAMTGSGSAIFGIFPDRVRRDRALKSFADERAYPIRFLSRAEYQKAFRHALSLHSKPSLWPPRSLYAR